MNALLLDAGGPAVRDIPFTPRPGEAVLRLRQAGLCATDLELVKGYMGFAGVLGHEFVATVESAPDSAWVGRRVVGEINCPCGTCATCRAGRGNHCPERTVLGILGRDGAMAERLCLPMANLHEVPANVPDDAAIFVEPLAAACRILEQVRVGPGDRVLVLGLGRLGQLCARVLATTGATVTGSSRQAWRRALLPEGIHAVEPDSLVRGYDIVVDTTGAPDGLGRATALVRPLGTVVIKTTTHDLPTAAPTAWVIDEITVIGSRCGPFATALAMLADGRVDPRPLITARYALADAERALGAGGMKVVIEG